MMFIAIAVAVIFRFVTRGEFRSCMPPSRFLADGVIGDAAQLANEPAVNPAGKRRNRRPGRLVHERHEFVGESRHGAANANPAHVRTAADTVHPSALGDVAIHHRPPTPDLDQALGRTIFPRKIALLIIACAVTSFVDRFAKKPGRP